MQVRLPIKEGTGEGSKGHRIRAVKDSGGTASDSHGRKRMVPRRVPLPPDLQQPVQGSQRPCSVFQGGPLVIVELLDARSDRP